ncbi:MAG: ATP-binding cassette domain-containing protein, partial [Pseudomonadota bacterium]
MLSVAGLESFYGRSQILHGIDFEADDKSIVTILGRNGVGKTTLLKTILGLTDRSTGTITFNGVDIAGHDTHMRARSGI